MGRANSYERHSQATNGLGVSLRPCIQAIPTPFNTQQEAGRVCGVGVGGVGRGMNLFGLMGA